MRPEQDDRSRALATIDDATYAVGVSLGTSLAGAVIVFVWTGTPWPLLAVLALGTVLGWWFARPASQGGRGAEPPAPVRRTAAAFTDWNSDALLGGFEDVRPAAVAPATSAAAATFVDEQG